MYNAGKCIRDAGLEEGGMAALGLTWEEAVQVCPHGVVPACHNSQVSVTWRSASMSKLTIKCDLA